MTDVRMSKQQRHIGVDPGPVPGIVVLDFDDKHAAFQPVFFPEWRVVRIEALQVTAGIAPDLVDWLIDQGRLHGRKTSLQAEKFVVGHRSSRSSSAGAGQVTRDLIGELKRVTSGRCALVQQTASRVKGWATDERLDRAGLLAPTKGMTHARDAARHALFCAVNSGGIPDPLSKKWSA